MTYPSPEYYRCKSCDSKITIYSVNKQITGFAGIDENKYMEDGIFACANCGAVVNLTR